MVLYQAKHADLEGEFNCGEIIYNRERKRSLTSRNILTSQILNCPNMTGKTPAPMHLKNRLDCAWFSKFSEEHADMKSLDNAWVFLRMSPTKLFQITFDRAHPQTMSGCQCFMQLCQFIQQFLPALAIAKPFHHHHQILIQCTQ